MSNSYFMVDMTDNNRGVFVSNFRPDLDGIEVTLIGPAYFVRVTFANSEHVKLANLTGRLTKTLRLTEKTLPDEMRIKLGVLMLGFQDLDIGYKLGNKFIIWVSVECLKQIEQVGSLESYVWEENRDTGRASQIKSEEGSE